MQFDRQCVQNTKVLPYGVGVLVRFDRQCVQNTKVLPYGVGVLVQFDRQCVQNTKVLSFTVIFPAPLAFVNSLYVHFLPPKRHKEKIMTIKKTHEAQLDGVRYMKERDILVAPPPLPSLHCK